MIRFKNRLRRSSNNHGITLLNSSRYPHLRTLDNLSNGHTLLYVSHTAGRRAGNLGNSFYMELERLSLFGLVMLAPIRGVRVAGASRES